jgi:carboxypeptidase Q
MRRGRLLVQVVAAIAAAAVLGAQECEATQIANTGAVVDEIRRLGLGESSQVMDHAFFLSDVAGPRLTGSPAFRQAGEWALARLRDFGLDVDREPFVYGRSWSEQRFTIRLLEPQPTTLIGTAVPWSASTRGEVVGESVIAPLLPTDITRQTYEEYVAKYKGKLRGRFVLLSPAREVPPPTQAYATRITDEELDRLSKAPVASPGPEIPESVWTELRMWGQRLNQFFRDEGVVALVRQNRGEGGMVLSFTQDWAKLAPGGLVPSVFLAVEHYNRIVRLTERGIRVRLALDLQSTFHEDPAATFNVIAEIPGTTARDEVVMVGAHLDSWTGGTGATDNAAGCAIAMEAMRILASLAGRPSRTIRLALWGGHEGAGPSPGGSPSYVRQHFGTAQTPTAEHRQIRLYLNLDNGGGRIRGVYLPARHTELADRLRAWFTPLRDLGASTVVPIGVPGGSDHVAFYHANIPAAMFAQDPLDYRSLTRHSNQDLFDRLHKDDMQQAATVTAAVLWQAATQPR